MSIEPEDQEDARGEQASEGSKKNLPPRREERLQNHGGCWGCVEAQVGGTDSLRACAH